MKISDLRNLSITIFLSAILLLMAIFLNINTNDMLLIVLPVIYLIIFLGIIKIYQYFNYPGIFTLNVVCFIRYVILPILIISSDKYISYSNNFTDGILLMIYEAICMGIFLIIVVKRYYNTKFKTTHINYENSKNYILKIIILFSLIIVITNPDVLSQYQFVFSDGDNIDLIKPSDVIGGLPSLIFNWGKILVPILLSYSLIRKYMKKQNTLYYITVALIFILFNVLFFSGTSRSSVIMPATGSMFFILRAFPDKRKVTFVFGALAILMVTIQLTLLKNTYTGNEISNNINDIISYLEVYFTGPSNLAVAIEAKSKYADHFNFYTFINDILGNFPGISNFLDSENRTSTLFNLAFYNGGMQRDQIIPSIGQGLFYFTYLFSFINQVLIIAGMVFWDMRYKNSNDIIYVYLAATFSVRFGFTFISSVSSILGFFYSTVIPMVLIMKANEYINIKIRRKVG